MGGTRKHGGMGMGKLGNFASSAGSYLGSFFTRNSTQVSRGPNSTQPNSTQGLSGNNRPKSTQGLSENNRPNSTQVLTQNTKIPTGGSRRRRRKSVRRKKRFV